AGAVGVVGYQDSLWRLDRRLASHCPQRSSPPAMQEIRKQIQRLAPLVVAVFRRFHNLGVGAERGGVDKSVATDDAESDAKVNSVGQRVQARGWILPVKAEIKREMITRAGGNDHERDIVLGRDICD